jgi:hypothetical protein
MALDLSSELTVILNSASCAMLTLEADHPARAALDELLGSVQRCAWKCSELLVFASRHGFRPARAPLAAIMSL